MKVFFAIMIIIGIALAWSKNDDVWFEGLLDGERAWGVAFIAAGIVGLLCVWMWP